MYTKPFLMLRGIHPWIAGQRAMTRAMCSRIPPGSATAAIHADAHDPLGTFSTAHDVAPPLSLSTTYTSGQAHVYSRISSPTRDRCEALLSAVESTAELNAHAVLYSSGLAATYALLSRMLPERVLIGVPAL